MKKFLTSRVIAFGLSLCTFFLPFAVVHSSFLNGPLAFVSGIDLVVGMSLPNLKINSIVVAISFLSGCYGLGSQFLVSDELRKRKIAWRSALISVIFLCMAFITVPIGYITSYITMGLRMGYYLALISFVVTFFICLRRKPASTEITDNPKEV